MKKVAVFFIHLMLTASIMPMPSYSQQDSVKVDNTDAPKVFLDCNRCDRDFMREEVTFVNYVRDRKDAQVHVLVTTQRTGSGGREYTLNFIGQKNFVGMVDTLKYVSGNTATDDEIRNGIARYLKLGLTRFVAKTTLAEQISISHTGAKESKPSEVRDRWNYWVFRISMRSFFQGQQSTRSLSLGGSFSANRVTDNWKIRLSMSGDYNEDRFDTGNEIIKDIARSYSFFSTVVKSINDHWSVGAFGRAFSSTFDNRDSDITLSPAIEFNLLPYSESTRRELRFLYRIGPNFVNYQEVTIFDKTSETLFGEELSISYETKQPWGSVEVELEGSHFFHDFSKNRLQLFGELEIRLFKGLSLDIFGSVSRIRDQLSLRKGGATPEEILLRRRELATSFRYFGSVRLSFTFGSIYSNVVNPRFGR